MEFLRCPLGATLAEITGMRAAYTTFMAEVYAGRPPVDDVLAFKGVTTEWQEHFTRVLQGGADPTTRNTPRVRKNSVSSIRILLDTTGACLVVTMARAMPMGDAKQAVGAFVGSVLPERIRALIAETFRPLDELDKVRLDAMQSLVTFRPRVCKPRAKPTYPSAMLTTLAEFLAAVPDEDIESMKFMPKMERPQAEPTYSPATRMTRAEFLAAESDEDTEVLVPMPRLSLCDPAPQNVHGEGEGMSAATWRAYEEGNLDTTAAFWLEEAKHRATIVLAAAGEQPLTYVRCGHEDRREAFVKMRLGHNPTATFADVVVAATAMAAAGQLKKPESSAARKAFLDRCVRVLKALNPSAEQIVKKLPAPDQCKIGAALDAQHSCQWCATPPVEDMKCLNPECNDEGARMVSSRSKEVVVMRGGEERRYPLMLCDRCGCPPTFGRTVFKSQDLVPVSLAGSMRMRALSCAALYPTGAIGPDGHGTWRL